MAVRRLVRKDAGTGGDSTQGLNRDVGKAYEVTKDKESRTDLYASGTSVGAVLDPGKTYDQWKRNVSLYGENSVEALRSLKDLLGTMEFLAKNIDDLDMASRVANNVINLNRSLRYLSSKDQTRREEGVRYLLSGTKAGQLEGEAKGLITGIAEMAGQDPAKAMLLMNLIAKYEQPQGAAQQNFVPVAIGGALIAGMAATLLAAGAATPENQARMSEAINSIIHEASERSSKVMVDLQVRLAVELVKVYYGTTFPVHLLDDESRALVNPILEGQGPNPASGGYAAGSQPTSVPTTGGSQIVDPRGESYTSPAGDSDLPSPGNVYSSGGVKITHGEHAKIRGGEGRATGAVINDVQISRPADILLQDDGRWVVRGPNGRIHILETDGELVTTYSNPERNTNNRIMEGRWIRPTQDELRKFSEQFSDYVRW